MDRHVCFSAVKQVFCLSFVYEKVWWYGLLQSNLIFYCKCSNNNNNNNNNNDNNNYNYNINNKDNNNMKNNNKQFEK